MRLICALVVVCLCCSFSLGDNSSEDEFNTLLKIAREYRYGKEGAVKSPLRAARFYELVIERADSVIQPDDTTYQRKVEAEYELMELLETDPTLSKKYSYLGLNIRAADDGHAEAQHKLSVAYATGIAARDLTPMDAGRGLFLEYMSALSGHVLGNMGMGYRYLHGIGVIESCEAALPHYEFAANYAAEYVQQHGGHVQHPDTQKLSETVDPSSRWSKRDGTLELADYYAHLAEQGDALAAVTLGNMLLIGTRHLETNETRALHYLNLAAEAQNPAGAGLQGYVLLQKFLQQVQGIASSDSIQAARDYASSTTGRIQTDRILKLLQFANKKGDVHGILGMGVSYFHGIGQRANLSRALDHMERTAGAHMDAGFYIGEICMGLQSFDLSGDGELTSRAKSRHRVAADGVVTDGIAKGNTPAETRALENHVITHAMQQKDVDPGAATRAYTVSAQLGHTLSQHRLAHLYKRGLSGPITCKETAKLLKAVAERGPWMEDLAHAHRLYAEGSEQAALYLFAQLAALGVESAQYNAAFILSRCSTRCAPGITATAPADRAKASNTQNVHGTDALERQHRSLKHSTATNFRALLQMHAEHDQLVQHRSEEHDSAPSVVGDATLSLQQGGSAYSRSLSSHSVESSPGDVAYLSAAEWREFLQHYQPDSLSTEIDLEFAADLNAEAVLARKERMEAALTRLYEARALTLFDLSAQQGNSEAFMQLGDFYYYQRAGLVQAERKREAAEFYQKAADLHHTQAIFNLGIMHEVGDGVSQDFHLAKRYYDQAAEVDSKARVPRDIALLLLEGHKTFNALFGPDALSEILSTTVHLPVSWTELQLRPVTVWELIEEIARLDRQMRRYIDLAVVRYSDQVLHPIRDALDILATPLRSVSRFAALSRGDSSSDTARQDESEGIASATRTDTAAAHTHELAVEHSVRGYCWELLTALPNTLRSLYDKAFEASFLLLHYLIRGQPHPALSAQHEEVLQLREEMLLVLLMCIFFGLVLAVKMVRRRIHEILRQGQGGMGNIPEEALAQQPR